jgi:hypothetical protein
MGSSGGWQFWLEDGGCLRQFLVAEPDEIKAREWLRKKQLKGKILSRKTVPENVIQILKMNPGELREWVASVQSDVIPAGTRLSLSLRLGHGGQYRESSSRSAF